MGFGRFVVVSAAVSCGCGGKSETLSERHDDPPGAPCKTSFACPSGERCDGGTCVTDRRCPNARPAELLFEAAAGTPWSDWAPSLRFTVLDGREYLTHHRIDATGVRPELTRFLELATGRETTLTHGPAYTGCVGTPAHCVLSTPELGFLIQEIELGDQAVTFREDTRFGFLGYELLIDYDADYQAGHVVVAHQNLVELVELGRLPPLAELDLGERRLQNVLVDEAGRSSRVVAVRQANPATGTAAELWVAPFETEATFTRLYSGPPGRSYLAPLPHAAGWFVIRDGVLDEPAVSVYRASEDGGTLVGTLDERWTNYIAHDYVTGFRRSNPAPPSPPCTATRAVAARIASASIR